jgi:hypothetical protein
LVRVSVLVQTNVLLLLMLLLVVALLLLQADLQCRWLTLRFVAMHLCQTEQSLWLLRALRAAVPSCYVALLCATAPVTTAGCAAGACGDTFVHLGQKLKKESFFC